VEPIDHGVVASISNMSRTDEQIWKDACKGDHAAWKELVDRYQSLVYTVALRNGLSMADASDCFQHTWLALWQSRKRLKEPERLSAWLVTTARRESIRMSRQSRRMVSDECLSAEPDRSATPDIEFEQLEQQSKLQTGLDQMGERCRKLLNLMFFAPEEHSYEQIAAKSGIAFNSLGPIRRRCLEQLKEILGKLGFSHVRGKV